MTEKVTIASQLTKSRGDSNLPTSENARNPTPLPVPNKEPTPSIETSASTSTYPSVSVSSSTFGTTTAYSKLDISERSDSYDYPVLPPVQIVHLSAQNRKIVATNIRHFLVLFWILLFASSVHTYDKSKLIMLKIIFGINSDYKFSPDSDVHIPVGRTKGNPRLPFVQFARNDVLSSSIDYDLMHSFTRTYSHNAFQSG